MKLIVNADEVPGLIANDNPIILSVQSLQFESGNQPGFLKGAFATDQDLWTYTSRYQVELDELALWGVMAGIVGIGNAKQTVLIYDNGDLKFASRIRFLLNHYGIENAIIVNGGWPAIKNLPSQPGPSIPVTQNYTAAVDNKPIGIKTRHDVREVVEGKKQAILIDVRAPDEYDGTNVFPGIKRPGHIPGAVNLPLNYLFVDPNNPTVLLDKQGLLKVFLSYKIDPAMPLIFYCQDGARSSLGALAAKLVDYPSVHLYYLSYLNWQSFADDPVVGPSA